jgi:hypothetical protein
MRTMQLLRGAVAIALLGAVGCAVSPESPGSITSVSPASAYADAPFMLNVFGAFRGAYTIDTGSGTGTVDARAFKLVLHPAAGPDGPAAEADVPALATTWIGDGTLSASMPAGIGKGLYDVDVRDPRGQSLSLPGAFRSLGFDDQDPMLAFTYPPLGTLLGGGTSPLFGFRADDAPGIVREMHWRASTDDGDIDAEPCPVPVDAQANICLFTVALPPAHSLQDLLYLELSAVDGAAPKPHPAMMQVTFPLVPAPVVPIDACSVTAGSTKGGALVTVSGTNIVPALSGEPASGTQIILKDNDTEIPLAQQAPTDDSHISFSTPPHDMGPVTILLRNGLAQTTACTFNYLPGPVLTQVTPQSGSRNGGTRVTLIGSDFPMDGTVVMLQGDVKVSTLCTVYLSTTEIHGVMPPGTGSVTFVVDGGAAGLSIPLKGAFAYDVDAPFDPSAWPVPGCDPGSGP